MGRYIGTGSAPANVTSTVVASTCYQVTTHKYEYDATEEWQNKVVLDTPGNYSFTVPDGVTCIRTIAVGGGGKSRCTIGGCCGTGGSGGAYAEKWDAVNGGATISVTVGRQEQDTTISYTNAASQARAITAGGAVGSTRGTASGGDWNSAGGQGGCNYNYCAGSVSHYCGSCIYCYGTTCCGYCVVWSGISARQIDPQHSGGNDCCNSKYAGGASAGSWVHCCGGNGQDARNVKESITDGYGAAAGGGGGIGYIFREPIRNHYCTCICINGGYNGQCWGRQQRNADCMGGSGGGGGSKWQCQTYCECQALTGQCMAGMWRNGHGGLGGCCNNEGKGQEFWWGWNTAPNRHGDAYVEDIPQGPSPKKYHWHDIHDMKGSGSSGRSMYSNCRENTQSWVGMLQDCTPDNSGEGAGTGGIQYKCCSIDTTFGNCCLGGVNACGTLNWDLICCLGTLNKICCADKMMEQIQPYVFACAGTLGGAGGTGVCHYTQKAGKGGGAGVSRSAILCICHGGNYNYCNNNSGNPLLAFPPSELDWRVSNAGTGMALIYWKDAS